MAMLSSSDFDPLLPSSLTSRRHKLEQMNDVGARERKCCKPA
jgi:hypothetical protein